MARCVSQGCAALFCCWRSVANLTYDEYGRNGQKECMVFARVGVLEVFQVFVLLATERSQRNQSLWVIAFESFVTNEFNLACL